MLTKAVPSWVAACYTERIGPTAHIGHGSVTLGVEQVRHGFSGVAMTVKQRPEIMFSRLASVLTRAGHSDFFDSLVKVLSSILGTEYVLIADIAPGSQQAHTLAVSSHGKIIPNFTYNLCGSPCETVPEREVCNYTDNVAELFPDDTVLTKL